MPEKSKISQIVKYTIDKTLAKKLSNRQLEQMAEYIGQELVAINLERIYAGLDNKGRKMKGLSRAYQKWKKRFIKGDVRKDKRMRKELKKSKQFKRNKAEQMPAIARLTGETVSSIRFKVDKIKRALIGKTTLQIRLYITGKSAQQKAEWLIQGGRKFFGISHLTKSEANRITRAAIRSLKE